MKPARLPFAVVAAATVLGQRPGLGGPLPVPLQRRWLNLMAASLPEPSGTVVRPVRLGGRPALRVTVGATERTGAIVHLHGGAYTVGSPRTHRSLAAFLAAAAGMAVYLPDYRLGPEHHHPAGLEDAVAAFGDVARRHDSVALSGDSAGGGLAVAAARRLLDSGAGTPRALALISPWVDPLAPATGKKRDLVVRERWGNSCAVRYLGPGDSADPGFAPVRGNLAGLPPTIVHIGKREVLYGQVTAFIGALRVAGVAVRARGFDRLWHVGHAQAGLLGEAYDAVAELGRFVAHAAGRPAALET